MLSLFWLLKGGRSLLEESRAEGVVPGFVSAINRLGLKFKIPLRACGVVVTQILDEFHDTLFYATQFISLSSTNYQTVLWKLFHCHNAANWSNALKLVQLQFCLPVSNGKLEFFQYQEISNNTNDLH